MGGLINEEEGAAPSTPTPGDALRVTCPGDTALRRQLPQLSKLPSRCVVGGDGTGDGMCLGLLTATAGS